MKKFILYIIFSLLFSKVNAQEKIENIRIDDTKIEQRHFNESELSEYKNSEDFNYTIIENEPNILERFWNWLGRIIKKILGWFFHDISPAVGFLKAFLQILPYLILGTLLVVILKFFVKMNTSSGTENDTNISSVFTSDEEKLIKSENLESLINKAIEAKEFRLAIRFYYLFVLKKLADKELIIWQQEKTNEDYIKEVLTEKLKVDFIKTTRLYDFVWYGNFDINEDEFQKAALLFNEFTKKIVG